jgi:hypothetical protein
MKPTDLQTGKYDLLTVFMHFIQRIHYSVVIKKRLKAVSDGHVGPVAQQLHDSE